jgi:hypothetical protein
MTTLAVCAVFKDEAPALLEWIAYHRIVGVDHFFLYDNESTDDGASRLLDSRLRDYVTVIPIASRPAQIRAYRHFIDAYSCNWDWVAFIDLDEFIHPIDVDSIKDLLPRYESYSGVLLHWLMFGPNGHEVRPDGLVIENYVTRLPEEDIVNRHVKSLVKTSHLIEPGIHVFTMKGPMCNVRGETAPMEPIQDRTCHDFMFINHYYTKSREDWDAKMRRGRADQPELRADPEYAVFSKYAQLSEVTDKRIMRFSKKIKEVLNSSIY